MRAPSLSEEKPQNDWDWYFLMQHSGAPTRLLDWTESALIALYFAVRDNRGERDAAVWILDPWWLNRLVVSEREVIPPGAEKGLFKADQNRYKPWLPDRFSPAPLNEFPVAVYPTHMARRISTQRSCFTVHGSHPQGIEMIADTTPEKSHLAKVIIPSAVVSKVTDELAIAGIDEVTIFPDLDGLGRYLNSVMQVECGQPRIEFKKAVVPEELGALCEFDKKVFHAFPGDLFSLEEWAQYESYWMIVDGRTVGCSALLPDVDYDEQPKPGCLFIGSTGVAPEFRRSGFGRKQKLWQIQYAQQQGFRRVVTCSRLSNNPIIRLNLEYGFEIRELSPDYYSDPAAPALVMDLKLPLVEVTSS